MLLNHKGRPVAGLPFEAPDRVVIAGLIAECDADADVAAAVARRASLPTPRRPAVPLADNLLATAAGLLLLIGSGAVVLLFLNAVGLR